MVCFVDDDPIYWGVAANLLWKKGIKTGRCVDHDVSAIHKMIKKWNPTIVIVCFKSTRLETLNSVKLINEYYPAIKVIICTQFSSLTTLKRCEVVKYIGYFFRTSDAILKLSEMIRSAM